MSDGDWALTPDGTDLDETGAIATEEQSYLDRMFVIGISPRGSFPEDKEIGAGLSEVIGSGFSDPNSLATEWLHQIEQDEQTNTASVVGRVVNGELILEFVGDIGKGNLKLSASIGEAGPRILRGE